MNVNHKATRAQGFRFFVERNDREVAHAYLYLLGNDVQTAPFGLMDDVLVHASIRGTGVGTELVNTIIDRAIEERCYKLIAMSRDSRPEIDELFRRRGFVERGKEFRIDF